MVDIDLADAICFAVVTLGAAIVQGALGFGFTLLTISFFLASLSASGAIQLIVVLNLTVTLLLVRSLWRHVPRRLWLTLAAGAVVGFPVGMWVFKTTNVDQIKFAAGGVVVLFALIMWFDVAMLPARFRRSARHSNAWSIGIGAVAGFMTTALGMPGPIVLLYLSGLSLNKDVVRATTITFLAFAYSIALLFHFTLVPVDPDVLIMAGLLAPVAVIGSWSGHLLSRRIGNRSFRHAVLVLIAASGTFTVVSVLR